MTETSVKKSLEDELETYLLKQKKKGLILGSDEIIANLDRTLFYLNRERVNKGKKEYFPLDKEGNSTSFDTFAQELIDKKLLEDKIYLSGDWSSFDTKVRSKGLLASTEDFYIKQIKKKVAFRDLEFPLTEDGHFREPVENTGKGSYSYHPALPIDKIIGPVQYTYLTGNVNGKLQNILLFADAPGRTLTKGTPLADFFRFLALKKSMMLDLLLESPFQDNLYNAPILERVVDYDTKEDFPNTYLGDLIRAFETSLLKNKKFSVEAMRVHYTDLRVRNVDLVDTFTVPLMMYLGHICKGKIEVVNVWDSEWLQSEEYTEEYLANLDNYKLTPDKLKLLGKDILAKFIIAVIAPIALEFSNFYSEEAERFEKMKNNVNLAVKNNSSLKKADINTATRMLNKLKAIQNSLNSAYMTLRILKPVLNKEPKPLGSLKDGETMSHVVAYLSQTQMLNFQATLQRIGFTVSDTGDYPGHVINYSSLKPTLDAFLA
jgi:stalled ribosome alternative rescue factor ArfA